VAGEARARCARRITRPILAVKVEVGGKRGAERAASSKAA
jgi:hypothetical protein